MGGFGVQGDTASIVATFFDGGLRPLGTIQLLPVTGTDPLGASFTFQQADASVPPMTRNVEVTLVAQRLDGDYNDGYFDNLWLSLDRRTAAPGTLGDVDGDGRIGPADVILLLRATLGLVTLTQDQIARADMNGDGRATIADAPLILQKMVGLGRL